MCFPQVILAVIVEDVLRRWLSWIYTYGLCYIAGAIPEASKTAEASGEDASLGDEQRALAPADEKQKREVPEALFKSLAAAAPPEEEDDDDYDAEM